MEHAQNTRIALASAVMLSTVVVGLAGCAIVPPGSDTGRAVAEAADHRALSRASAERYVQEQLERGRHATSHRMLVRSAVERYVEELTRRAQDVEARGLQIEPQPNLRQLLEADRSPAAGPESPSVAPRNQREPVPTDRPPAMTPEPTPSVPKGNLRQQMESDRAPAPAPGPPLNLRLLMEADRPHPEPRLGVDRLR